LPMDRWCNGKDECDNRVDEPRSCTSQYRFSIIIFKFSNVCVQFPGIIEYFD
jgi:hypothetical protein